ncbi:translation initiation factor IF-2-like isoform X1 [Amphibalanus amphitrite]|uniref:translation initiation factor IF-2-like isoform X1 n=1 Tax=Amphibalanus amphitrite TaxID=1232801 RepID=UPI001C92628C|nr:translation initiation factor IF-2-like isoform X1 [Amphibalanus amphitrite]
MLPLSCMSIKPVECFPNQNGKSSLHCSFQPRPWSPVTLLAVESEASIRSALLFQRSAPDPAAHRSRHAPPGLRVHAPREIYLPAHRRGRAGLPGLPAHQCHQRRTLPGRHPAGRPGRDSALPLRGGSHPSGGGSDPSSSRRIAAGHAGPPARRARGRSADGGGGDRGPVRGADGVPAGRGAARSARGPAHGATGAHRAGHAAADLRTGHGTHGGDAALRPPEECRCDTVTGLRPPEECRCDTVTGLRPPEECRCDTVTGPACRCGLRPTEHDSCWSRHLLVGFSVMFCPGPCSCTEGSGSWELTKSDGCEH